MAPPPAGARRGTTPPRRADAERNIATIIATGLELFSREGDVSMAEVARAAGLGRVTLYAHFPTRADLLTTLLDTTIAQAESVISAVLAEAEAGAGAGAGAGGGGNAEVRSVDQTLAELVSAVWPIVSRFRNLRRHALTDLGAERLNARHNPVHRQIEVLIRAGREQGTFRTDQPVSWLVTVVFGLIHTATDEVNAGHLTHDQAPGLLVPTILGALAPRPESSQTENSRTEGSRTEGSQTGSSQTGKSADGKVHRQGKDESPGRSSA